MSQFVDKLHRKILLGLLLSFIVCLGSSLAARPAGALSGNQFNATNIIDDSVFFNKNSMSASEIQNFLNAKVPVCDTNGTQIYSGTTTRAAHGASRGYPAPYTCLKSYAQSIPAKSADAYCSGAVTGGTKSASQIIYDVSQACGVSPKVLIVLLQKEQSLVTDDWPWSIQYRSATGYGCPDTAACDSAYYGFFNQVYNAARQFQRYTKQSDYFNYASGRTSFISYQANSISCGGTNVTIQNSATAALYNYTPYQPNAAALANLYGTGDSCSAYGNRNFWRMYNDWFGSTYALPTPASIIDKSSAVSQAPGKINVFARGSDGRLWQKWLVNGVWSPGWNYIDGPSSSSSAPSAISFGNGHMDVFEIKDGQLRHNWYKSDPSAWRGWGSLGQPSGVTLSNVSAVSQTSGKINVFARGSDGRLWQKWLVNGVWSPGWNYIDGPSSSSSAPSAISFGNGHMDVFEIKDGQLRHNWYKSDPSAWRGWGIIY